MISGTNSLNSYSTASRIMAIKYINLSTDMKHELYQQAIALIEIGEFMLAAEIYNALESHEF